MNHRQHKAMRFEKLLWIIKKLESIDFLSNKYIPSKQSGLLARISSRITTDIRVVKHYQINDNWFNEPFAVSLYKLLILRHAWLNLWDKHMATGRINQITILRTNVQGLVLQAVFILKFSNFNSKELVVSHSQCFTTSSTKLHPFSSLWFPWLRNR